MSPEDRSVARRALAEFNRKRLEAGKTELTPATIDAILDVMLIENPAQGHVLINAGIDAKPDMFLLIAGKLGVSFGPPNKRQQVERTWGSIEGWSAAQSRGQACSRRGHVSVVSPNCTVGRIPVRDLDDEAVNELRGIAIAETQRMTREMTGRAPAAR